ncbi:MAG: EamA family transporter [Atopobiaceae bacterium]|nr:EamA family transporter [Atopobiaceae bacterium]
MNSNRMVRGIVSTLAGAIAWGMSGTCVQYLFEHSSIDSLLLTSLRQIGAGIMFLAVLLLWQRPQLQAMLTDSDTRHRLVIFGVAGLFLNSVLYATTISYTNAGTATVLQSLNVPMVLALACLVERRLPRRLEVAALVCAALATFLIATGGDPSTLQLPLLGLIFGIATAAASVFYTTYPQPLFERWGSFATTGIGMAVAGMSGFVLWWLTRGVHTGFPQLGLDCWAVLGIAAFVGTFGAYGLFLHGVSIVGPIRGNMLGAAEPVSATVLTAVMLGTAFSWADWTGLVLMVATIALVTLQSAEEGKAGSL